MLAEWRSPWQSRIRLGDAAFEEAAIAIHELTRIAQHQIVVGRREQFACQGTEGHEVLFGISADDGQGPVMIYRPAGLRVLIKGHQDPHQSFNFFAPDVAGSQQAVHHPLLGHLPHDHRVFDHPTGTIQAQLAVFFGDPGHPPIEAPGQPPVELDFLPAEIPAPFQRAEVQEIVADRFFNLVDQGTSQEHVGDVGLEMSDPIRMMGVGFRLEKRVDDGILFGSGRVGVAVGGHETLSQNGCATGLIGAAPMRGGGQKYNPLLLVNFIKKTPGTDPVAPGFGRVIHVIA